MKKGDRVEINAPGTAWHGFTGTISHHPVQVNSVQILLDHGSGRYCWYRMAQLLPEAAIDRLADLGRFLPTPSDVGRGVVYTPYPGAQTEDGVITSINDDYVFVRYQSQHPSARGQATKREDLRWLAS